MTSVFLYLFSVPGSGDTEAINTKGTSSFGA